MDMRTPPPPAAGPEAPPPPPRRSWTTWIVLALALAAFYWWQASASSAAQPEVDYSTVVQWLKDGKVKSVVMRGEALTGELDGPQALDGRQVKTFHTLAPVED